MKRYSKIPHIYSHLLLSTHRRGSSSRPTQGEADTLPSQRFTLDLRDKQVTLHFADHPTRLVLYHILHFLPYRGLRSISLNHSSSGDMRSRVITPRLWGLFWYPRLGWELGYVPLLTCGTQPNWGYQNRPL
ncbi:hypothetical protein AVEN_120440-1 [Araneus ventricosus]|uniref:Uncharacterized protein n=1 Tax=Araneus ventricosus TaxID=182803 RepID=A0A4Y2V4C4_ARAVE|nr:hypothetical protein AVEN_120440-1 [Araneus ventricosus]